MLLFLTFSELKRRLKAERQAQKKLEKQAASDSAGGDGEKEAKPKNKGQEEEEIDATVRSLKSLLLFLIGSEEHAIRL